MCRRQRTGAAVALAGQQVQEAALAMQPHGPIVVVELHADLALRAGQGAYADAAATVSGAGEAFVVFGGQGAQGDGVFFAPK